MDENDRVSMDEIEAEDAVSLPTKEVLSLLDVNANVDLGLDLAAPVDLAAAANLNVAAPIEASADGITIAATCRIAEIAHFRSPDPAWHAVPLFRACCDSFLASFKIWNTATIGGNICMSLPAGPMISLRQDA